MKRKKERQLAQKLRVYSQNSITSFAAISCSLLCTNNAEQSTARLPHHCQAKEYLHSLPKRHSGHTLKKKNEVPRKRPCYRPKEERTIECACASTANCDADGAETVVIDTGVAENIPDVSANTGRYRKKALLEAPSRRKRAARPITAVQNTKASVSLVSLQWHRTREQWNNTA